MGSNMKNVLVVAALAVGLGAGAVQAADLIVDEGVVDVAPAATGGIYGKLFGGGVFANNLFYLDEDYDTDAGWIVGAAVGFEPGIEGLSFELDATTGSVTYTGYNATLAGTTLMGNVVYTLDADAFEVYGGAGVGGVLVAYNTDEGDGTEFDGDGIGAAFQVFAGAGLNVTDNINLFAEARYQAGFDDVTITNNNDDDVNVEWNRAAILVGLKISN